MDTVLPKLNTFSIVKDNIREAVEKGWTALCPQRNITLNSWNGQGWIIVDPASGAAGYLLAGRLVSGDTVEIINGGSATEPTGTAFARFMAGIYHYLEELTLLGVGLCYLGAIVKLWPHIVGGGALVTCLTIGTYLFVGILAIAVIAWLIYMEHKPSVYSTRRRKYMYC